MIPLMAVSVLTIMLVNFVNTKNSMTNSAYQKLEKESNANVLTIEGWSGEILASLNSVQNTLESVPFLSDQEELSFLETTMSLNSSVPNGVYEGDAAGKYLDGSGWVPGADYVVTERGWYQEGLTHETFAFGEPYVDADSGSFVVSASTLIKGKNNMVAAADVFLDDITTEVSNIQIMDSQSGYAFLVDGTSSMILAHKDTSLNASTLSTSDSNPFMGTIAGAIQGQQYGIQVIKDGGIPYLVNIEPVHNTSWVLVSCVSQNEVLEELNRMQVVYAVIALIIFVVAALIMSYVIRATIAPIKILTTGISRIADGDFTVDITPKGNDEITVMSAALKDYIATMNHIIKDIMDISKQLEEKSEVVDTTNANGFEANEKMKNTVDVASEGYKDMQNVQKTMVEIVKAMQERSDTWQKSAAILHIRLEKLLPRLTIKWRIWWARPRIV